MVYLIHQNGIDNNECLEYLHFSYNNNPMMMMASSVVNKTNLVQLFKHIFRILMLLKCNLNSFPLALYLFGFNITNHRSIRSSETRYIIIEIFNLKSFSQNEIQFSYLV